jgi:hypothetical protein
MRDLRHGPDALRQATQRPGLSRSGARRDERKPLRRCAAARTLQVRCGARAAAAARAGCSPGRAQTMGVGTSVGCVGQATVGKSGLKPALPPRLKSVGCGMGAMGTCGLQRGVPRRARQRCGARAAHTAGSGNVLFATGASAPEGERRARRDQRAVRRAAVVIAARRVRPIFAAAGCAAHASRLGDPAGRARRRRRRVSPSQRGELVRAAAAEAERARVSERCRTTNK